MSTSTAAPPIAPAYKAPRGALFIVWLVVFIDLLGFGIVLPVMPRQVEPYLAGLSKEAQGAVIGTLFSVFSLMQFVFSPMWGRVSDRIGRRPVLLISLLGSVVFYALYGLAVTFPPEQGVLAVGLLLVSRIGAGIAGASVGTAAAVIADCTPPEKRAKGMALIGIAFGFGFTFGPLIAFAGLELFQRQAWGVGALASGLSAIALVFAVFRFQETRNPENKSDKKFFSISETREVLQMPTVGALVLIYFLAIFAFAQFEATLALLTQVAFGMSDKDNFLVFATVGGVLICGGGAYRPLLKKHSVANLLKFGVGLMMLGLIGLGAVAANIAKTPPEAPTFLKPLFYLAMATGVVGFAFVNPSVSALVSRRAGAGRQGEVIGVNQAFASLGRILGPFLGSILFKIGPLPILPYVAAVGLLLGVVALLPRVKVATTDGVPHPPQDDAQGDALG